MQQHQIPYSWSLWSARNCLQTVEWNLQAEVSCWVQPHPTRAYYGPSTPLMDTNRPPYSLLVWLGSLALALNLYMTGDECRGADRIRGFRLTSRVSAYLESQWLISWDYFQSTTQRLECSSFLGSILQSLRRK